MDRRPSIVRTNIRDVTDTVDAKFARGVDWVEKGYDDRWPARGQASSRGPSREYPPLENVSRASRQREYLRRPDAKERR